MKMHLRNIIGRNGIRCIGLSPYALLTIETDFGTYYPEEDKYLFRDKEAGTVVTMLDGEKYLDDCYIYGNYLVYSNVCSFIDEEESFRCVDRNGAEYKGIVHDGLYIYKDNSLVLLTDKKETVVRVFDENTNDIEFTDRAIIAMVDSSESPLPMYMIYEYNGNKDFELSNRMNERARLQYFTYLFMDADKLANDKEMAEFLPNIDYKDFGNTFEYIEAIIESCKEIDFLSEKSYQEYINLKNFFKGIGLSPSITMLLSITYANMVSKMNAPEEKVFFCTDEIIRKLEELLNERGTILFLKTCSKYKDLCKSMGLYKSYSAV